MLWTIIEQKGNPNNEDKNIIPNLLIVICVEGVPRSVLKPGSPCKWWDHHSKARSRKRRDAIALWVTLDRLSANIISSRDFHITISLSKYFLIHLSITISLPKCFLIDLNISAFTSSCCSLHERRGGTCVLLERRTSCRPWAPVGTTKPHDVRLTAGQHSRLGELEACGPARPARRAGEAQGGGARLESSHRRVMEPVTNLRCHRCYAVEQEARREMREKEGDTDKRQG